MRCVSLVKDGKNNNNKKGGSDKVGILKRPTLTQINYVSGFLSGVCHHFIHTLQPKTKQSHSSHTFNFISPISSLNKPFSSRGQYASKSYSLPS